MSTTKAANEYAESTLDDIDYLLQFLDKEGKLRGDKDAFRSFFPAVYVNPDTHRGEEELLGAPEMINDFWPFNHSVVFSPFNSTGGAYVNGYRIRSVSRKEAAGRVKITAPRMLRVDMIVADSTGRGSSTGYYGIFPNGDMREISLRPQRLDQMAQGIMAASLTSYYDWHVVIGRRGSSFQVRLPATPTSAREFLSLRDVPDGRERRAAIKHWVAEHQRRPRTPEEYDVRAHLRGREDFTWGDYEGWVEPSRHDLAKVIK